MKKASKRRILFAARMATMVGAACFAVSGISETLGQEKEKSRPVYIATEEVAETTYMPEVEEATQPTETAKAVETEEPLIASMDWDKDDSWYQDAGGHRPYQVPVSNHPQSNYRRG